MQFPYVLYQDQNIVIHIKALGASHDAQPLKFMYQVQRLRPTSAMHSRIYETISECICEAFIHLANVLYGTG